MSRNGNTAPALAGGWLEGDQQRAWLAYIRVQLRLSYEMNRQLLADSGMSLPDYDVLTALSVADRFLILRDGKVAQAHDVRAGAATEEDIVRSIYL